MYPKPHNYRIAAYGILFLMCLSSLSLHAQRKEITYKDNNLVLFVHPKDTSVVMDPLTGEEKFVVTSKSDDVLSLNREKVHRIEDEEVLGVLRNAIEKHITSSAQKLDKATYHYYTETVVINKKGNIVYLQPGGIFPVSVIDIDGKEISNNLTKDMQVKLMDEIVKVIESTKVPPVEVDGEPVNIVAHVNGSFIVE